MVSTKEISVFVDESGSFDPDRLSSRYYMICMVFHNHLKEAFAIFASRTEFIPEVEPSKYRLFQVADIACTLELARTKLDDPNGLSPSENVFFGGPKRFRKNYLKLLDRKRFI